MRVQALTGPYCQGLASGAGMGRQRHTAALDPAGCPADRTRDLQGRNTVELLSGADMIARFLQDEGVEYIYGYPGGAALHIYDALFRQDKVKHILVRHEQAATHAADGYARASGKPGVVLVTSGPGATNAVTGIATAYMDSIPMVVLCGQVMSHLIGDDAFQETDIVGVTRPIVKHSFSIRHPSEIPEVLKKAFYLASTGRPGPVVVDIPKDMTAPTERYEYVYPKKVKMRSYNPVTRGHTGQIKKSRRNDAEGQAPSVLYRRRCGNRQGKRRLDRLGEAAWLPDYHHADGHWRVPAKRPPVFGLAGYARLV